ncbi:MAG: hypothetical protein IT292_03515 [Deltaproteobacteria bacterium]|nr:hypothetical protein [Deltaproteobacteria bacterium]
MISPLANPLPATILATLSITNFMGAPSSSYWILVAVLAIAFAFTIALQTYRRLVKNALLSEVNKQLPAVEKLINNSYQILGFFERQMLDFSEALGQEDVKYLVTAKKIVSALEARYTQVVRLITTRKYANVCLAHSVLFSELSFNNNGIYSLVESVPLKPLAPEEWAPTLEGLFMDFERDASMFQQGVRKTA